MLLRMRVLHIIIHVSSWWDSNVIRGQTISNRNFSAAEVSALVKLKGLGLY